MMNSLLQKIVQQKEQNGLRRMRRVTEDIRLNFSSNDYLGLANDSRVKRAFQQAYADYPASSSGSFTVCGYHKAHQQLEMAFCERLNVDAALLFNSGYAANLAVMALLSGLNCHAYIDKSLHASLYDGIALSKTQYTRYLHNNPDDLKRKLGMRESNKVIITEGIFSMSGQQPDLHLLSHQALCLVDEAHSFGVTGLHGLGAVAGAQLTTKQIPLRIIPFGKAMGAQGAIVAGCGYWIEALLQYARSNIYSTSMSPAMAKALQTNLQLLYESDVQRTTLQQLIVHFRKQAAKTAFNWRNSTTAIQQLQLGCPHKALHYSKALYQRGILCQPMRYPTVSYKETGLRIVLNCQHDESDINFLMVCLEELNEY